MISSFDQELTLRYLFAVILDTTHWPMSTSAVLALSASFFEQLIFRQFNSGIRNRLNIFCWCFLFQKWKFDVLYWIFKVNKLNSHGENRPFRGRKQNLLWWLRPRRSLIVKYFSFEFYILGYIFISNNSLLGYINHVSAISTEREVCFLVLPMGVNSVFQKKHPERIESFQTIFEYLFWN